MNDAVRRLRLVHPFPSLVNAGLVFALALVAGGGPSRATVLAVAMLGLQFCIGTVNDIVDERRDALTKPWKPIPSGLVPRRAAVAVGIAAGGGGLGLAAAVAPPVAAMAAAMLACGLAYDLWLKPTRWSSVCFAVAFAILPVYAWYGAVGLLPPRPELLLPLAALAGPQILLANGLADLERDRRAGLTTLATRLGRRRSVSVIGLLLVIIHGAAWITLPGAALAPIGLAIGSTVLGGAGLVLSAAAEPRPREYGWMVQAASLALLGLAWVSAAVVQ